MAIRVNDKRARKQSTYVPPPPKWTFADDCRVRGLHLIQDKEFRDKMEDLLWEKLFRGTY